MLRIFVKKLLRLLARHTPGAKMRIFMLRLTGCRIGKNVHVGEDILIIDETDDWGMIEIGDRVAVSSRTTLIVSSRPNFSKIAPYVPTGHAPITIERDAWLGACVSVMPGIRIGEGAVVAANAVVIKDVEPYTIVGGVPAKLIRKVEVPWIT